MKVKMNSWYALFNLSGAGACTVSLVSRLLEASINFILLALPSTFALLVVTSFKPQPSTAPN